MDLTGLPAPSIVGYIRVSTAEQREGWSLANQRQAIEAFASQNGLRLVAVCEDAGRSGGSLHGRHGLGRALDLIRQGGIGALVAWREDRLGRRVIYSHAVSRLVFSYGAEIITLNPFCRDRGSAGGGSGSDLVRPLMAIHAEEELDSIRRRVRPGLKQAAINGCRGGRVPLGYVRVAKGQVAVDEPMAAVMRRCFDAVQNGTSVSALVRTLASEDVRRPDGGSMTFDQLQWSLTNPFYTGALCYRLPLGIDGGGQQIRQPGHHPAIIDAVTFAAVQQVLAARASARPTRIPVPAATVIPPETAAVRRRRQLDVIQAIGTRQQWAVHGIVPPTVARCAACGATLYATLQTQGARGHRRRVPVYICHVHKKFGNARCDERPAPADRVDAAVTDRLQQVLASGAMAGVLPPPAPSDLREIDRQVVEAEARCARCRAVLTLRPQDAKMGERLAGEVATLQRLQHERAQLALTHRVPDGPLGALQQGSWEAVWPTLAPEQRRSVVQSLLSEVRIGDQMVLGITVRSDGAG
jgi:DNA invertase Pin-like site-specific DNA recombinase